MTIIELRDWIDSNGIQMLFGDSRRKIGQGSSHTCTSSDVILSSAITSHA